MMKKVFYIMVFLQLCFIYPKTSFPGFKSWLSPYRMALGGSGYLSFSPLTNRNNPASLESKKTFYSGLIRYPSSIMGQTLAITMPKKQQTIGLAVQNLSYGTFNGYNSESIYTEKYSSSDTWINFYNSRASKWDNLKYGLALSWFKSSLANNQINAIVVSLGLQFYYKPLDINLGISLNNHGNVFKNNSSNRGELPKEIVISSSKKLLYLPMKVFFDGVFNSDYNFENINIGGEAQITTNIEFIWGSSLNKISQNTSQSFWRSFLAASGTGLAYNVNSIKILYSSFFLGTGVIYNGFTFQINIL